MNNGFHHESRANHDVDRLMNRLVGALLAVIATALMVLQAHPPR
jgi:hypothetical protein